MVDIAGSPSASERRELAGCPHLPMCHRYFFNFNGTWVCLVCDVTRAGEHDPEAPPATGGHPH